MRDIPFREIQERAVPFVRVLVHRWIPRMAERGEWLMGPVPWREDKHPSFGVSLTTGWWRDFARGDRGDLIDLLMRTRGLSKVEAAKELARAINFDLEGL